MHVGLGSPREQAVLAILLLDAGRPVPTEAILGRLWDDSPSDKARSTVTSYVTRLREKLRQVVGDAVRISPVANGYQIDVPPEVVDLHRFSRKVDQARALGEGGDDLEAVAILREADGEWRGEPLAGLPGERIAAIRRSLEERRRAAVLDRIRRELRLGRHRELVPELYERVERHPLDEELAEALMTALYHSGRVADALAVYRTAYECSESLGLVIGPRLRELQEAMLRRDPGVPGGERDLAGGVVVRRASIGLPENPPELIGRDREIARLEALVSQGDAASNVSIEGMPGVGKSALAVHLAHRLLPHFPGGVVHLRLRGFDPAERTVRRSEPALSTSEALGWLLSALGMSVRRIPDSVDARAQLWRRELATRRLLVVLDDVQDVRQVRPLLASEPGSLVIMTSRRRLTDVPGCTRVILEPLDADDAITLFRRCVQGATAYDEGTAARVVRLSGRIPLAIHLAAAQLDGPDRLEELAGDLARIHAERADPGPPGTVMGLASTFELSRRGLSDSENLAFRRIGLLPCVDLNVPGVAAMIDGDLPETVAVLETLCDFYLLQRLGAQRYRMHDLIHSYAQGLADATEPVPEQRKAFGRLLDHYLRTADRADRMLDPQRRRPRPVRLPAPRWRVSLVSAAEARAWLEREWHDALQVALFAISHEWQEKGARLVACLAAYLDVGGHWTEAADAHAAAVHAWRELRDPAGVARSSLDLAKVEFRAGRMSAAKTAAAEALETNRSLDDRAGTAEALDLLGILHWMTADYREALAYFDDAYEMYRAGYDRPGEAEALAHKGIALWHLGEYGDARVSFEEALELFQRARNVRGEAKCLNNLGDLYGHLGYHRDAAELYTRAAAIFDEIEGMQDKAVIDLNRGNIHLYKGELREALECYLRALRAHVGMGDPRNEADVRSSIGMTYLRLGRHAEALVHLEKAAGIASAISDAYERARAILGIADVHCDMGQYDEAASFYREAQSIARQIEDPYLQGRALVGAAEVQLRAEGAETARLSLRQALKLFQRIGVPEAADVELRLETLTSAVT